ncbi:TPA: hypothetical protein QDC03_007637, partial [Burkholderia cepacia]|nr:hypothetical protein [Burkholderia cepacia]
PPLSGGQSIYATALGDNGAVLLSGENSSEHQQAATWTFSTGTSTIGLYGGGQNDALDIMSRNGAYAAGIAEDNAEILNAVMTTLP